MNHRVNNAFNAIGAEQASDICSSKNIALAKWKELQYVAILDGS